jgi:hypothetical protein
VIIDFLWGALAPLAMNHASIVPGLAEQARANHRDLVLASHLAGDESGLVITRAGGGDVFGCGRCAGTPGEAARWRKPVGAVQYQGSRDSWRMLHSRRGAVAITGAAGGLAREAGE